MKYGERMLMALAEGLSIDRLARKAALGLSDFNSASLTTEEADRFIDLVVDESVLLKAIRVHRTNSPSGTISKLTISGPVTRKATEGSTFTATRKPSNSVVTYNTVKTVSGIDINGEVQEDTIEGSGIKGTVMGLMVKQVSNDMESLSIEGDESISGSTDAEELLKTNDGFLIKTDAGSGSHIVDATGLQPSVELMGLMLRNMPTKYKKDLNKLRWLLSSNAAMSIQEQLAGSGNALAFTGGATAEQVRLSGVLPPRIHGVQPLVVPLIPEDLTIDGTAGDTGTFIMLTDPQNLIYVVQRVLTVEWERVPRGDRDEGTIHMRTDFVIENTDAVVRADNVNVDTDVAYYGVS